MGLSLVRVAQVAAHEAGPLTAVAASHRRPTMREQMASAFREAELFALEQWCRASLSVDRLAADVAEHGPSASYGRALMNRDRWHVEAERCGMIAGRLEALG